MSPFGDEAIGSVVDAGVGVSIISVNLYDKLVTKGTARHEISINNTVLTTAFGNRSTS
jgi:hypothetical protein